MSTIWILIIFWGHPDSNSAGKGVAAAEFANERSCRSAIVPATTAVRHVRAICVAKEIK